MTDTFQLRCMAHLLAQGRTLNAASLLLLGLSGAGLLLARGQGGSAAGSAETVLLASGVALGLAQAWFAIRIGFDARLLRSLAEAHDASPGAFELAAKIDASLQALGLLGPDAAGRSWPQRWQGMQRLLHGQVACVVLQALFFLLAVALLPWISR